MSFKTKDLKITFLGVTPILEDKTGTLKPQDIVALSALMTFKGKSVKGLYEEVKEKGQDIDKKVKTIIRKSSLRGHASIATTPVVCFTYEGSKFIDSMMTGAIFSSSLMASGRRTNTTIDDIVYPTSIDEKKEVRKKFQEISENLINFYNKLLEKEIEKDDASKILQYGIYGTGIIAYPLESVIGFKKETELEEDWMPEEAKLILERIEKYFKKMGLDLIYASRDLAARNTLPFPNIFKNPEKNNLTRELLKQKKLPQDLNEILDFNIIKLKAFEKEAGEILKLHNSLMKNPAARKKNWRDLLEVRQKFMRDWNNILSLKILSSVSWRVWSEKKRHRTVPMVVESIYYSLERCQEILNKLSGKIKNQKLSKSDIQNIDRVFTIPRSVSDDKELLYEYIECVKVAIDGYFSFTKKHKIKPADALFMIPRGLRIDLLQEYDLFNLISGYYPLRTCSTAEIQLREITRIEMAKIKTMLTKKGYPNLSKLIMTKCHIPGFCLEETHCPMIKGQIRNYDEKMHEEAKAQLDEEFEKMIK